VFILHVIGIFLPKSLSGSSIHTEKEINITSKEIYFITGSSGAGKTTLLKGVVDTVFLHLILHQFDDRGIPSIEEMKVQFGGPTERQADNVRYWMVKHDPVSFSMRQQKQPELDTVSTYAWAAFLGGQADALRLEIIDTMGMNLAESIHALAANIGRFAKEKGISLKHNDDK